MLSFTLSSVKLGILSNMEVCCAVFLLSSLLLCRYSMLFASEMSVRNGDISISLAPSFAFLLTLGLAFHQCFYVLFRHVAFQEYQGAVVTVVGQEHKFAYGVLLFQ